MSHFQCFLASKEININILDKTEEYILTFESILCSVKLFQEFASYLSTVAVTKYTDTSLASSTALQYLSGAKDTILKRYPLNSIWLGHDAANPVSGIKPWYFEIRRALENAITLKCILSGDSVENKAFSIGRSTVQQIVEYHLKKKNT